MVSCRSLAFTWFLTMLMIKKLPRKLCVHDSSEVRTRGRVGRCVVKHLGKLMLLRFLKVGPYDKHSLF
jgi:hypothetical protein